MTLPCKKYHEKSTPTLDKTKTVQVGRATEEVTNISANLIGKEKENLMKMHHKELQSVRLERRPDTWS